MLERFADYEDAVENYVPNAKGGGLAWPRDMELGAFGLAGESGEYVEKVKKLLFHGYDFDAEYRDKMLLELGDILWYLAYSAKALGTDLENVAERNIEKLRARYPHGFTTERSINRVER